MTFYELAKDEPDRVAIVDAAGQEITYGQLGRRVNQVTHGLRALGLGRGSCVLLVVGNRPAYMELALATGQAGMYFTPVNRRSSADEIRYFIADSGADVIIAEPDTAEMLGDTGIPAYTFGEVDGWRDYETLTGSDEEPEDRTGGLMMMYTSGTSGRPKAVQRVLPDGPPDPLGPDMLATLARLGYRPGPGAHLVACPLYHAGPGSFAFRCIHLGQTLVLMDHFDAEQALRLIEKHRVTTTHLVPTMFHRMLRLDDETRRRYDLTSLESAMHGAAPCPPQTKRRMIEWLGPVVYEYYGSTDGGLVTAVDSAEWLAAPGTVGTALPGVRIRILGDDHQDVPTGETGTIYASSPATYFEYLGDPDKTASARAGEYVTVGDLGSLDENGRLFLKDRRTDLIISGGVNIYPAEVEARLLEHPEVVDAAVVGEPDEEWGQRVVAYVQVQGDPAQGNDEKLPERLIEFCRAGLARFKAPRRVEIVAELPRTESGKMRRRLLRS